MHFLLSMNIALHKMMVEPWFWPMIVGFAILGRYILLDIAVKYGWKKEENLSSVELKKKKYLTYLARGLFTVSFIFITYFVIIILFL